MNYTSTDHPSWIARDVTQRMPRLSMAKWRQLLGIFGLLGLAAWSGGCGGSSDDVEGVSEEETPQAAEEAGPAESRHWFADFSEFCRHCEAGTLKDTPLRKQVTWQFVFNECSDLKSLRFELPPLPEHFVLDAFSSVLAIPVWQAIPPGTEVRFVANFGLYEITYMNASGQREVMNRIVLEGARPFEPSPDPDPDRLAQAVIINKLLKVRADGDEHRDIDTELLGAILHPSSAKLKPLLDVWAKKKIDMRVGAAKLLGHRTADAAIVVPHLTEGLNDPENLIEGDNDPEIDVIRASCQSLAQMGEPAKQALPKLFALAVRSPNTEPTSEYVQDAAFEAIAKIDATWAVTQLSELLKDPNFTRSSGLTFSAIQRLSQLGPEAIPELARMTFLYDTRLPICAIRGLGSLGPAAVPSLLQVMRARKSLFPEVMHALQRMGPDAAEAVPDLTLLVRVNLLFSNEGSVPFSAEDRRDMEELASWGMFRGMTETKLQNEIRKGLPAILKTLESIGPAASPAVPAEALAQKPVKQDGTGVPGGEPRSWTDTSGQHRVEATLISSKDGKVTLRKSDGSEVTLALEKLSREDREFVRRNTGPPKPVADKAEPAVVGPVPIMEEQAIAEIERLGGQCKSDEKGQVLFVSLSGPKVTNAELEHLKGLTGLRALSLANTQVTDTGLEHVRELTNLRGLQFYEERVTDAGLEHLKGLTKLENLRLDGTQVTDAGLEYLKGLTGLVGLSLNNTQVTDEGVKKLKEALPSCRILR